MFGPILRGSEFLIPQHFKQNEIGLRISDPPNILNRTKLAIFTDSEGLRISDPLNLLNKTK